MHGWQALQFLLAQDTRNLGRPRRLALALMKAGSVDFSQREDTIGNNLANI